MKVVCIDSEIYQLKELDKVKYDPSDFYLLSPSLLTLNKIYDVIKVNDTSYDIIDDTGNIVDYSKNRFITLEDHRDKILIQLGVE